MMKRGNLKKVVGILGVVALLLSVGVLSVAMAEKPVQKPVLPEQASEKAKEKELKLIWQKEFDEEIEDVLLDYKEEVINGISVKIPYPKVIMSKRTVKYLNAEGRVEAKIDLDERQVAYTSENGEFVAILTYKPGYGTEAPAKLRLMDKRRRILWEKDEAPPGVVYISNHGKNVVAMGNMWIDDLCFYGPKGEVLKRYIGQRLGRYGGGKFAHDGSFFIYRTSRFQKEQYISYFDEKANEVWRYTFDVDRIEQIERINISDKNSYVIVTTSKKTLSFQEHGAHIIFFFTKEGKLLNEYTLHDVYSRKVISSDERYTLIRCLTKLYLFENETGKLLWKFSNDDPLNHFIAVDISPNGENIFAIENPDVNAKIVVKYLSIFNRQGKRIRRAKLEPKEINESRFGVKIKALDDGKFIQLSVGKKYFLYENVR